MTWFIIGIGIGLIIGWNLLPQPAWVKAIYNRAEGKVKEEVDKISE